MRLTTRAAFLLTMSLNGILLSKGPLVHASSSAIFQDSKQASGTTLAPLTSKVFGSSITFNATVTPATATGKIVFKDGANVLGDGQLSSGSASFSTSSLAPGDHHIQASYSGDEKVNGSDSSTLTQSIVLVGIVTNQNATTLAKPHALSSDTCLMVVPSGAQLLENGARIELADILKQPRLHNLTVKEPSSGLEAKISLDVFQRIQILRFTSDAAQVFAKQTKDFSQTLTVNDENMPLNTLLSQDPAPHLPTFVWTVKAKDQADLAAMDGRYTANNPGPTETLSVTVENLARSACPKSDDNKDATINQDFTVLPNPGTLYVDPVRSALLPNSTVKLTAEARSEQGIIANDALVDWSVVSTDPVHDPNKFISIVPSTGSTVTVVGHFSVADLANEKALQSPIAIQAEWRNARIGKDAKDTSNDNPKAKVFVIPQLVVDFRPVKVKLEPVDDETAEALFGSGMQKNFWILRIRLNNNLRDEASGRYLGSSILVFSESMEMAVSLEKKYNKRSHSDKFKSPSDPSAAKAAEDQVFKAEKRSYTFSDDPAIGPEKKIKDMWTPVSARRDFEGFLDLNPEYTNGIEHPEATPTPFMFGLRGSRVRPGGKLEVWEPGDDAGKLICRSDFFYRPYSYEIVLNTVASLEEKSGRARTFKIADAIGLITSVVTSVAVPGKSSDLPRGLDKYSNIFIPGIQKLWKDMSETHRQNLVSMTMKPIEEIPFGAEISKIVFFPKQPFAGIVRGHYTRISQVCPYYFHATAAVLSNEAGTTSNQTPALQSGKPASPSNAPK